MIRSLVLLAFLSAGAGAADLRLGIIGTDTSHVTAFTRLFNGPADAPEHVAGARVVAALKAGSPDLRQSADRVEQFAEEIRTKYGVEIVPDIPALLAKVDAVLLLSVDGRRHLAEARAVIAARKPVFIDKPLASTLEDARAIATLAAQAGVPWFSASSLRFGLIGATMKFPDTTGVTVWSPGELEPHHYLDLSWYGIHGVELLYTLMGTGCESVTRTSGAEEEVVVGRWKDGRVGTVRAVRTKADYGAVIQRKDRIVVSQPKASEATDYRPLVLEIVKFFQTGKPPVPNNETLEIFTFMDAAQKSKEQGGAPVKLR